ncbi:Phosphatidylserine synthase 2-like [Oopsacas minuta]|uniref:Phosphatidylserine synthase n=1 Tax=Oopsacas minuta TaxID=111878 RepID=A0AAV7KCC8_9METZ|nr:Phosphatidylserine synthase 2-like [Oopsacas minuta]
MSKRQTSKQSKLLIEHPNTTEISESETRQNEKHSNSRIQESNTYFWRAHTVTALIIVSVVLVYVTMFEIPSADSAFNMRRGVIAVTLVFILVATIHMPDGPFLRPHPVVWRLVMSCSIVYLLFLIFLLFQNHDDVRQFLVIFDPKLGRPLPERTYAEDCRLYVPENVENPYFNMFDKMDVFVPCHFFGWWVKALILRDFWILNILSFLFEIMEYLLEHQLPNFGECWWDHWILDFVFCNGLGICFGMLTLHYLSAKTYQWRSLYNIPTFKGKLKRAIGQFMPYSWTSFHWGYMESLYRWLVIWCIVLFWMVMELNTFYLKAILWVPANHILNFYRVTLYALIGSVSIREMHDYLDDKTNIFGRQAWITVFLIIVEVLIEIKFGEEIYSVPWPRWVVIVIVGSLIAWCLYTIFYFYSLAKIHSTKKSK